jgi:iron complex transport system ATP-binding protein
MQKPPGDELRCDGLTIRVPNRTLIDALTLESAAGEMLAVLGPNGVGKTLLLQTIAGLRRADAGRVGIGSQWFAELSRQQLALRLALLPQYTEDFFPSTVLDTVMIGRHPHIARWAWASGHDFDVARGALQAVDLDKLENRDVLTLSGGERRRLAVAQVLTQEPSIYLLDEPTNHLDPQHQLDVLRLFRRQADAGKSVIVSLHDVNLAARFADQCLLLFGNGRWECGETQRTLTAERLSALYATRVEALPWRDRSLFVATG